MPLFSPFQSSLLGFATPSRSWLGLSPLHPSSSEPLSPQPGLADPSPTLSRSVLAQLRRFTLACRAAPFSPARSHVLPSMPVLVPSVPSSPLLVGRATAYSQRTLDSSYRRHRAPSSAPRQDLCPWASIQQGFLSFSFTAMLPLLTQGKLSHPPSASHVCIPSRSRHSLFGQDL